MATVLPKKSVMQPIINNTPIPKYKNLRVLGHYLWNDKTANLDIEKKLASFELSLKYLPVKRMELDNIRKVIHAKCISLFTHIMEP